MIKLIIVVLAVVATFFILFKLETSCTRCRRLLLRCPDYIVIVIMVVVGGLTYFSLNYAKIDYVYSEGERTGVITKFTNKGLLFKTWEGQMNLGGVVSNGDGGVTANVWNFSVTDPEVVRQLILATKINARVTLSYEEYLLLPRSEANTNYLITKINAGVDK